MSEWRSIPGFSAYEVSDEGCIRRPQPTRGASKTGYLRCSPDAAGYHKQILVDDAGRRRFMAVHAVVLGAFVGPRPEGCDASHKNGHRDDNRLSNLCWESRAANNRRKAAHGTQIRGEQHKCSKLTAAEVTEIRARAARGETLIHIAKTYGVSHTLVGRIRDWKVWKHAA